MGGDMDIAEPDVSVDAGDTTTTTPDMVSGATVTVCSYAMDTPASGESCAATEGPGDGIVLLGRVLQPDHIYEGGAVVIDDAGFISCVGCDCADKINDQTRISCPKAVISPGLINTHDHMGWMNGEPWTAESAGVDPELRWEHRHDWRKGKRGNPKISAPGGSASVDEKAWGELRFLLGGATSVNGSGVSTGLMRNLDRSSGLEGLTQPYVDYETFPLGDSSGKLLNSGCNYSDNIASAPNVASYTPHVSEGIDVEARNEFLCLTSTANGGSDQLSENTAIIHGIGLHPSDIAYMSVSSIKLIWSPRSNISLYGDTAQVTLMHNMGIDIALGTDWMPSGSMNVLRELQCADYLNTNHFSGYFSDRDLWRMTTLSAARAMAMDDAIGVILEGRVADITIFDDPDDMYFRAIIEGHPKDVALVLRGGEVLSGDAHLVEALESGCDTLNVCGTEKRVCLQREINQSLNQLTQSAGSTYPLFYCENPPENEPTCVPSRTLNSDSVEGSNLYPVLEAQQDGDGDGIADGDDNCAAIFNPVRPLDQGYQSDFDGDGLGDVCDPCPIDPDTTDCTVFDPDDKDLDGVKDLQDNCPGIANEDQVDTDNDQKGDPCDLCPEIANPGNQGCPYTVYEIQDWTQPNHPEAGTQVGIDCAVTGVNSLSLSAKGFWCQDRQGGPYAGIFVFTAAVDPMVDDGETSRLVQVGDDLHIDGLYTEYFDLSEIATPVISLVAVGEPIAATVVSPGDIATGGSLEEQYEGMLVTIEDVEVIDTNPDSEEGKDYDEFVVDGPLRIDDLIVDGGVVGELLDNNYPLGTQFSSITGLIHYSYSNWKVLPRTMDDVVEGEPTLKEMSPALVYLRIAEPEETPVPQALMVYLTGPAQEPTEIQLESADINIVTVPETVVIEVGSDSAVVPITALAQADPIAAVTITATLDDNVTTADVVVLEPTAPATVLSLSMDSPLVLTETSAVFHAWLDWPAPIDGTLVHCSVLPNTEGLNLGSVDPVELTVAYNSQSANFQFHAGADAGTATVECTGPDTSAVQMDVSVVSPSNSPIDISGWTVSQANNGKSFTFPEGTILQPGEYVLIARKSTLEAFQSAWFGAENILGANVHFFNAEDSFIVINDSTTTFTLTDGDGVEMDGPTLDIDNYLNYQRSVPVGPADSEDSWTTSTEVTPGPSSGATPGSGQGDPNFSMGIYISEISDGKGSGNYVYEFVEIFYDGPLLESQ
jgi:hypothetical protein